MIEDKLSHDERVRLECLVAAINSCAPTSFSEVILDRAKKYENFIKNEEND